MSKNPHTGKSALRVQEGIEQPPSVNPEAAKKYIRRRVTRPTPEEFTDKILKGNRPTLGRAITLIESQLEADQETAQEILRRCLPHSGNSMRIGITGVPGVGKSSFIEVAGKHLTALGHRIAVLAIDPSSSRSGGSILGDKTRMEQLANDPQAFIRPSPSAGSLGGVARKTHETLILCEAAGYDIIFIETVGVGQSEIAVHSMVDFFLLLMLAGAGDELQGIKRGIMEMADVIAITKADGDNLDASRRAMLEYQNALHLFPAQENGWVPKAVTLSAYENRGISDLWDEISRFFEHIRSNGSFALKRRDQALLRMHQTIREQLSDRFYAHPGMKELISEMEREVLDGTTGSYPAAGKLISRYWSMMKQK